MVMDHTFKPAGLAIAAIVAGIAPAAMAETPVKQVAAQAAKEQQARETLIASATKFEPAEPFAERETGAGRVTQPGLFD